MTRPEALRELRTRLDHGRGLVEAQRFRDGEAVLQGLADELGERPPDRASRRLLARVLVALHTTHRELGRDGAADLLERAWSLAEEDRDRDLQVALVSSQAFNLARAGMPDRALRVLAGGEELLAECGVEDRVRFLLNRGFVRLDVGDLDEAGTDLGRAEDEGVAAGLYELAQKARHNRGYLAFLQGDLPRALDLFASGVAGPGAEPAVSALRADPIALIDRARVLQEAGLVEDGDDLLQRSLAVLGDSGRRQDEGEAHLLRARGALVVGDLDLAAAEATRAADHFAGRGNERWALRTRFVGLAIRLEQCQERAMEVDTPPLPTDDRVALGDEIERLARTADEVGDLEIGPPAWFMLAEAALLVGDTERAARALAGRDAAESAVSVRLRWYRARAGLAAARGADDLQDIVHHGLAELGRAQARLGSVDLRTAMAIHGRELAELGVDDALRRADPSTVHLAVERSHASSTRIAPVRPRATPREREQLGRLRRANDALWRRDESAGPDRERDLRTEITRLQRQLRQQEWQRSGVRSEIDLVGLAEVRRRLGEADAVAASYVGVGPRLWGVRIDQGQVAVVELGDLEPVVREIGRLRSDLQAIVLPGVPEAVRAVMRESVTTTMERLDERLVRPLELGGASAVVVPHGPLALVPWPMVPSRIGVPVTTVPSLTMWARLVDGSARATSDEVVAVAGPGLERARSEASAVAGSWSAGHHLHGRAATGEAVLHALGSARIVHLATHGQHQASSPLFSSLLLDDGPIFAHELDPDPSARLVVLSSCEVGSHTMRRGDEPLGLTAALLQAGVPTVLAGLARVRDEVAHDVMLAVHEALVAGRSPAMALAGAVRDAHARGQLAPFGCLGAGLVPVS